MQDLVQDGYRLLGSITPVDHGVETQRSSEPLWDSRLSNVDISTGMLNYGNIKSLSRDVNGGLSWYGPRQRAVPNLDKRHSREWRAGVPSQGYNSLKLHCFELYV